MLASGRLAPPTIARADAVQTGKLAMAASANALATRRTGHPADALRPSLPRWLPLVPVLPLEECVLDFIMDAQEPGFRACGTIAKMRGFSLQFSSSFFRGAQLK